MYSVEIKVNIKRREKLCHIKVVGVSRLVDALQAVD
jgi:hypothetical protein